MARADVFALHWMDLHKDERGNSKPNECVLSHNASDWPQVAARLLAKGWKPCEDAQAYLDELKAALAADMAKFDPAPAPAPAPALVMTATLVPPDTDGPADVDVTFEAQPKAE